MEHTYADRKRETPEPANIDTVSEQPSLVALLSGAAQPGGDQLGRRVDLPDAMREKMENAFGTDFSAVKLYESRAVAEAGANAVTQGSNIAFAPGMLDFTSYGGQVLLGHELSHVASQTRGEVTGGGFLNDGALEARADREGAMAASGQQIPMPTAPLSAAAAAPAAGPMQADKAGRKVEQSRQKQADQILSMIELQNADPENYSASKEYKAAEQSRQKALRQEERWSKKLTPMSVFGRTGAGDRVLQGLMKKHGGYDSSAYYNDADRALGIMGGAGSQQSQAVLGRLGAQASESANKNESMFMSQLYDTDVANPMAYRRWRDMEGSINRLVNRHGVKLDLEDNEYATEEDRLKVRKMYEGGEEGPGSAAHDAMVGNANRSAIAGMKQYRKKLKGERGNDGERTRQMGFLKDMIHRAKADDQARQAGETASLPGGEFTGTIKGGGINQVYRYERGGENAYFKPKSSGRSATEKDLMERSGVQVPEGADPRLSQREIAFARLGSLLGTEVTLGSKAATLGEDTPSGRQFGDMSFNARGNTSGVLTQEAKGKGWSDYNWVFPGLTMPESGWEAAHEEVTTADPNNPNILSTEPSPMQKVLFDEEIDRTQSGNGADEGAAKSDFGARRKEHGFGLGKLSTRSEVFDSWRNPADPRWVPMFADTGPELDMSDPDYQRQMNELFLVDTIAAYKDRHMGNFKVNRDDQGKITVRAIDNDVSFGSFGRDPQTGADRNANYFGKSGDSPNYSGLPSHMQIDANMAKKIRDMDRTTLELTFSDLLSKDEIDALWARFGMMKDYISAMEKEDPSLIVDEWNEQTSQRELDLAGGANAVYNSSTDRAGGYRGNNYYQRQAVDLNFFADKKYTNATRHL